MIGRLHTKRYLAYFPPFMLFFVILSLFFFSVFFFLFILFLSESVYFFPLKSKNHRVGGWAKWEGTSGRGKVGIVFFLYIVPVQYEREWEAELEGELNE